MKILYCKWNVIDKLGEIRIPTGGSWMLRHIVLHPTIVPIILVITIRNLNVFKGVQQSHE